MSYTKLYSSILDSSVWSTSKETRLVWITMLAMATKNGVVHASVGGLARRANVTLDECRRALKELEGPDPDSKDGTDGQRVEAVTGAWFIKNFEFYRETKSLDAVRKAQQRARASGTVQDSTRQSGQSQKRSPAPEADTEAEDPPTPLQNEPDVRSDRETKCPLTFEPSPEAATELQAHYGLSALALKAISDEFVSYWTMGAGSGKARSNWQAKFREHLRLMTPPKLEAFKAANPVEEPKTPVPRRKGATYVPPPDAIPMPPEIAERLSKLSRGSGGDSL